jgi:hypothetical protein
LEIKYWTLDEDIFSLKSTYFVIREIHEKKNVKIFNLKLDHSNKKPEQGAALVHFDILC